MDPYGDIEAEEIRLAEEEKWKAESKAWRERVRSSYYEIVLENKILCLLEPPSYETFMFFKVIMSHDDYESTYKQVNKSSKGTNTTTTVKLIGWPSTIILGTDKTPVAYMQVITDKEGKEERIKVDKNKIVQLRFNTFGDEFNGISSLVLK